MVHAGYRLYMCFYCKIVTVSRIPCSSGMPVPVPGLRVGVLYGKPVDPGYVAMLLTSHYIGALVACLTVENKFQCRITNTRL